MTTKNLTSRDRTRSAYVYLVAGTESTYRTRAEKYPENGEPGSDWFGGRVLWGADQTSMEAAVEVAERWVNDGELPREDR